MIKNPTQPIICNATTSSIEQAGSQGGGFFNLDTTGSVAPSFSPADLSNLVRWYDANDEDSITTGAGNHVASWENKASVNSPAVQNTASLRPVYHHNTGNYKYLDFQKGGSNSFRYLDCVETLYKNSEEVTQIVVLQKVATTIGQMPAGGYALADKFGFLGDGLLYPASSITNTGVMMTAGIPNAYLSVNQPNSTRLLNIGTVTWDSSLGTGTISNSINVYGHPIVNGLTTGTAVGDGSYQQISSQDQTLPYRIGVGENGNSLEATTHFQGHLHELIEYDRVLTTTERQQVELYLSTKWGL